MQLPHHVWQLLEQRTAAGEAPQATASAPGGGGGGKGACQGGVDVVWEGGEHQRPQHGKRETGCQGKRRQWHWGKVD